jgi:glycosyltransferase involved in cell wall biosynthesis
MTPCGVRRRDGRFTVFFYGSFIPLHGIEHILGAAERLQARGGGVRFVLCGTGQTYPRMRRIAVSRGISNRTLTVWPSRSSSATGWPR